MCKKADVDMNKRAGELTEDEVTSHIFIAGVQINKTNNLLCWSTHQEVLLSQVEARHKTK